ncbi:MAG: iron-containing alcohol dehydrogenase [Chlorobiaceae bacterium]|nr:iron-containing alcohol dehydrogenase [Chlorobiaceae bacterium]
MSTDGRTDFFLLPLPRIHFGPGRLSELVTSCSAYGRNLLLVTGTQTMQRSVKLASLFDEFSRNGINCTHLKVDSEPSPELIDRAVSLGRLKNFDVVAAVGGGSVMDAGKAVSAMLLQHHSVERFIEGQEGVMVHDGRKVPFIAVPTTSGTGSEVTNNAVISRVGLGGYKRSLRHPAFVPDVAIVDPELMLTASPSLTAASGMDAFTQLMEAYLSPFANPYTDAVALSGLEHFSRSFVRACQDGAGDVSVRAEMAYAALMSGMALVNAGLGIVHGFASSVGGLFDIPHGTLCATLLAESTRENILQLRQIGADHPALVKFAKVGEILGGQPSGSVSDGCDRLVARLEELQSMLGFPRLGEFGVREADFDGILAVTRSRSNAVKLGSDAMKRILSARL